MNHNAKLPFCTGDKLLIFATSCSSLFNRGLSGRSLGLTGTFFGAGFVAYWLVQASGMSMPFASFALLDSVSSWLLGFGAVRLVASWLDGFVATDCTSQCFPFPCF